MDKISALLQAVVNFNVSPAIFAGVAMVVEFLLRMVKSDKPLGLIHTVSGVIVKVAAMLALAGQAVGKLAELTDKVLPQKIAPKV